MRRQQGTCLTDDRNRAGNQHTRRLLLKEGVLHGGGNRLVQVLKHLNRVFVQTRVQRQLVQTLRRNRTRRIRRRQVQSEGAVRSVHVLFAHGLKHAQSILLTQNTDHGVQVGQLERLSQRSRRRTHTVRVVARIQDGQRLGAHNLQTARRAHRLKRGTHHVLGQLTLTAEERLHGGESHHGVLRLMRTVQGQRHIRVLPRQAAQGQQLTADRKLTGDNAELHALKGEGCFLLAGGGEQHVRRFRVLCRRNQEAAGLDNAGLFGRNLGEGFAQHVGVVQTNRGDHGNHAVGNVRGVPGAADTDLEHHHVHRLVRENREGEHGNGLEEGEGGLAAGGHLRVHNLQVGGDFLPNTHKGGVRYGRAVNADTLGDAFEVRAGKAAHAQVVAEQQRLNHAGGAGLAVRAGDVDDRRGTVHVAEDFDGARHSVQARRHLVFGCSRQQFTVDPLHALGVGNCGVILLAHCSPHWDSRPVPAGAHRAAG